MLRNVRAVAAGLLAALFVCCAVQAPAQAETWPDKTIRLVVPAGPGGPTDVLARIIADRLTAALPQPVIIDNRGGAPGRLHADAR
jgi:tripartite-type tricarboxylate transporter receptor subunit TctC